MKADLNYLVLWIFFGLADVLFEMGKDHFSNRLLQLMVFLFAQFMTVSIWAIKIIFWFWPRVRSTKDMAFRGSTLAKDFLSGVLIFGLPFIFIHKGNIPFSFHPIYILPFPLIYLLFVTQRTETEPYEDDFCDLTNSNYLAVTLSFCGALMFYIANFIVWTFPVLDFNNWGLIILSSVSFYFGIYITYTKETHCEWILSAVFFSAGALVIVALDTILSYDTLHTFFADISAINPDYLYYPIIVGAFIYPVVYIAFSSSFSQGSLVSFCVDSMFTVVVILLYSILKINDDDVASKILAIGGGVLVLYSSIICFRKKTSRYNVLIM